MLRTIRWIATALCVLLLAGWVGAWVSGRSPIALLPRWAGWSSGPVATADSVETGLPAGLSIGGPFALTDQTGKRVTDADFRGRWMLLYFGYTTCPDVCPTALQTMASALDSLGARAAKVVPVFITIDPARDTPAILADYVKQFGEHFVGLTGTDREIAQVAREFRVYYAKVTPKTGNTYLMDHSSFVYLIGPEGGLSALFRPGMDAATLASAIGERV